MEDVPIYTIHLFGSKDVGNKEIIKRYTDVDEEELDRQYNEGFYFSLREIVLNNGLLIKLKLVYKPDQSIFSLISCNNIDAIIFVFSYDSLNSFDDICGKIKMLEKLSSKGITKYLIGNYCDSIKKCNEINDEIIQNFLKEVNYGFKSIDSSLKYDKRIEDLFEDISERMFKINNKYDKPNEQIILKSNSFKYRRKNKSIKLEFPSFFKTESKEKKTSIDKNKKAKISSKYKLKLPNIYFKYLNY